MQLYASKTSPYARLIRAIIIEKRLGGHIRIEWCNPWESPEALLAVNPYCRVPTLVTGDGTALTENLLIAYFLEREFPEPALLPDPVRGLARLGLAQGLIDAAVDIAAARRMRKLPADDPILARRHLAIPRALETVTATVATPSQPDMGDLALAVALGYLDFRLPERNWRATHPALAEWHARLLTRPSLAETGPEA